MIRVTIIGGAGYTGGELLRILINHPGCEIKSVHSRSQAGRYVNEIHTDLVGETNLVFSQDYYFEVDIVFLCLGHGESKTFLREHDIPKEVRIVDLTQDFRYAEESDSDFVYGLPEFNRLQIMNANNVANPGCFATAIQLALLPLAKEGLLQKEIHASGITGSTGAGQALTSTSHFTWRNSNISLYKPFIHQHLAEINHTLASLQNSSVPKIRFLPFRGNFTRGILASVYTNIDANLEMIIDLFSDYYEPHPFVSMSDRNPDIKQVVNTNKAILHLQQQDDQLLVVCVIDNLTKGASGQAVQNMNLMFSLDETSGLKLKPVGY
jgi:N-acetyl-gamma-glutamyl-phosphate reductase